MLFKMLKIFKLLTFINIIILFTGCSFNNPGGIFEDETVNLEKKLLEKNSKLVFKSKDMNLQSENITTSDAKRRVLNITTTWLNMRSMNIVLATQTAKT